MKKYRDCHGLNPSQRRILLHYGEQSAELISRQSLFVIGDSLYAPTTIITTYFA